MFRGSASPSGERFWQTNPPRPPGRSKKRTHCYDRTRKRRRLSVRLFSEEPNRAANQNCKTDPICGRQTNPMVPRPNEPIVPAPLAKQYRHERRLAVRRLEKKNPFGRQDQQTKALYSLDSTGGRTNPISRCLLRGLQNKANPGRQPVPNEPTAAPFWLRRLAASLQWLPVLPLLPPANLQFDRRPLEPEAPPQLVHQVPLV